MLSAAAAFAAGCPGTIVERPGGPERPEDWGGSGGPGEPVALQCGLELIDAGFNVVDHLDIGRWEQGYEGDPPRVRNALGNNFVDRDPERFFAELTHAAGNRDPNRAETLTVRIETRLGSSGDDDATAEDAVETGPNTGVFRTRAQLLTSPDLPTAADDDFAAHDGVRGPVADDLPNDRTHRTARDGAVRASFSAPGFECEDSVPVCDRDPETRRTAKIRIWIFNDGNFDLGYDHDGNAGTADIGLGNRRFDFTDTNGNGRHDRGEPSEEFGDVSRDGARGPVESVADVMAHVERANVAWAQACIRFETAGTPKAIDAPYVRDVNGEVVDALSDGLLPKPEILAVINGFRALTGQNPDPEIADVFFGGPPAGGNGFTVPPSAATSGLIPQLPATYRDVLLFVSPLGSLVGGKQPLTGAERERTLQLRTLAHELGHALTNDGDVSTPRFVFFPSNSKAADDKTAFRDDTVNSYRRLSAATIDRARTKRAVAPGPGPGNAFTSAP